MQSAVSAGAVAVTPPGYMSIPAYACQLRTHIAPPRTAEGGMAGLPRWLARTLGWAWRGRTADLATWTSAAYDSMLFSVERVHVFVRCSYILQNYGAALQQQHELGPVQ